MSIFWDVICQIFPSHLLVNLGFALFALDALLTSWVSNHLRKEQSVLCAAEEIGDLKEHLLKALKLAHGSSSQIDELTLTKIGPIESTVKSFVDYMKEQESEKLVRYGFLLAAWDIVYFFGVSILAVNPATCSCLMAIIAFVVLTGFHLVFKSRISSVRRKAVKLQSAATEALSDLKEMCIWRQVPINETKTALQLKKIKELE